MLRPSMKHGILPWLETNRKARFFILRQDDLLPDDDQDPLSDGYHIIPKKDDFPYKEHILLPYANVPDGPPGSLDAKRTPWRTLHQWLEDINTFESKLFRVKVSNHGPLHQIVRPTEQGLAMEILNPEYEVVIKQGGGHPQATIHEDILFVRDLIFDTVLRIDRHYSTLNWKTRTNLVKSVYDRKDCDVQTDRISWHNQIPSTGIVRRFYDEQANHVSSLGRRVESYGETRGQLLRFIRHFSTHVKKREYLFNDDPDENAIDFNDDEYLDCVFSEIFRQWDSNGDNFLPICWISNDSEDLVVSQALPRNEKDSEDVIGDDIGEKIADLKIGEVKDKTEAGVLDSTMPAKIQVPLILMLWQV
ncbi:hypothetical protein AgCh_014953 [Apium graveolens]